MKYFVEIRNREDDYYVVSNTYALPKVLYLLWKYRTYDIIKIVRYKGE